MAQTTLDHMVRANRGRNKKAKKRSGAVHRLPPELQAVLDAEKSKLDSSPSLPEIEPETEFFEEGEENNETEVENSAEEEMDSDVVVEEVELNATVDEEGHDSLPSQLVASETSTPSPSSEFKTLVQHRVIDDLRQSRPTATIPLDRIDYVHPDDNYRPGTLMLELPAEVRGAYAAARTNQKQPLREYLVQRLARCQAHTADKPIYVGDYVRQNLERIANRNFDSDTEILEWIIGSTGLSLGRMNLRVDPNLIERALARKDADQTDSECLSEYLTAGIEIKTGMR